MSSAASTTIGLVISGGGSRASFQLGALRYLYDTQRIRPSVITGTSVGAILAAHLAQYDDYDGQRRALATVERIGQNLRETSDLLTPLPWYAELAELMPALQRSVEERRPVEPRTITLPALGSVWQRRVAAEASSAAHASGRRITLPSWDASPVLDTLSLLWTVGKSGTDLELLVRGAQRARSLFTPGPIVDQLLDPQVLDVDRLARSGTQLRIAVVGLESGELRYVTGDGTLMDRENVPVPGVGPVPMVEAIRASCAIPGIFPPVRLGEEHYVDGGTRENAPVEIAVTHLGVDRCYAVLSSAKGLTPETSYADKDMLAIVLRATAGIMADEVQVDDVARLRAGGVTIIAPEVNLHDELTIEPGLLQIASDYGYLRAGEVCEAASEGEQRITREIVETRQQLWRIETGSPARSTETESTADGARRGDLTALRSRLPDLLAQVPPRRLPPGATQW